MAIIASKLYTALKQANVTDDVAIAAAEEVASMEGLAKIEAKLDQLSDDINKVLLPKIIALEARTAEMSLRIAALPTTVQMITLVFGILTGAFFILRFSGHH
jgi:hypothetical protein